MYRHSLCTIIISIGLSNLAWADFESGMAAYDRGDYDTAFQEMLDAAKQDDVRAKSALGYFYEKGIGVPEDNAKAVMWYRSAAEEGHISAQDSLGRMYGEGRGVPQDSEKALKWFRLAAEQGDANAQYNVGTIYMNGEGVSQNYGEGLRWFRRAAEQGHSRAQYQLGVASFTGRGAPQHYRQAAKWFRLSAEQGLPDAQEMVGSMYATGNQGLPRDYIQAHMWLNLAASRYQSVDERDRARRSLEAIAGDMTSEQILKAQDLASVWSPKNSDWSVKELAVVGYKQARESFWRHLYNDGGETLYCGRTFGSGYNAGINIAHVFPMAWVTNALKCGRLKQCRETSDRFNRIEADLHNLYPARTEINDARGAMRYGEIPGERRWDGDCDFEVDEQQRAIEPRPAARGEIARAMFYMSETYGLIIFDGQGALLKRWHREDPVSDHERWRNDAIERIQGRRNMFIDDPTLADRLKFQ